MDTKGQNLGSAVLGVASGVELVTKAGNALTDIAVSVHEVSERVSDIAHASMEQATGIEQVTRAVAEMDNITQQNAELAVETTKALQQAQTHVMDLRTAVSFFKFGQATRSPLASEPNQRPVFAAARKLAGR